MKIKEIATKTKSVSSSTSHTKKCCVIKIILEDKDFSIAQFEKLTTFIQKL